MIGNMPDRRDGNPQARIRPRIRSLDTGQSALRIDGRQHAVTIVERIAQVFHQLRLGLRRSGTAFFAMLRRSLALNFVEEREIGASYVLHLLRKRADSLELARA